MIKKSVEKIMKIAIKEQGGWAGIPAVHSPLDMLPYKQIVKECGKILKRIEKEKGKGNKDD